MRVGFQRLPKMLMLWRNESAVDGYTSLIVSKELGMVAT